MLNSARRLLKGPAALQRIALGESMDFLEYVRTLKRNALYRHEGPKFIRRNYKWFFGKELPDNPTTFTEKVCHKMISLHVQDNPMLTRLADKILVRDFVEERIGREYINPIIWQGTDPSHIPFDSLPDKCMAKTNHGSGFNYVLARPVDRQAVNLQFRKWLHENYYFVGREIQYKKITPSILIEPFIIEDGSEWPHDYRFWCFGGRLEFIQADNHAHDINTFFDMDWNRLPFYYRNCDLDIDIPKPRRLPEMIEVATRLSYGFDFVRVDLFHTNERIIFGEMTFMPLAGMMRFIPPCWDRILGEKWQMSPT